MYAESSDISTSFARHPEDRKLTVIVELVQLALVDGSNTQLSLDGTDKRWTLKQSSGKRLQSTRKLFLASGQFVMKPYHADVLLSSALLRLDQSRGAIDADNQTSCHFRVERSRVTCSLNAENALDPCDDFVRGGIRRLVKVDDTAGDV